MFFKRKVDKLIHIKSADEKFAGELEGLKKEGLEPERKDRLAMVLAAYLIFIPEVLLVGGLFALVIWMFLGK